jgi:hypothetical protein
VVVDRGVQVVVADDRVVVLGARTGMALGVPAADGAAEHAPTATVRDLAEFLDVDRDQLAWPGALIAAYDAAGGTVEPGQTSQSVTSQHPMHRRGMQPEQVADPRRPPAPQHPDFDDAPLGARRRAPRRADRP